MAEQSVSQGQGPVVPVKPQPDIYTLLTLITFLVLVVTIGIVLNNLMSPVVEGGYGLTFEQLFQPFEIPPVVTPPK